MTIQKKSGRKSLNLTVGDFVVVQEEQPQRDVDRVVLGLIARVAALLFGFYYQQIVGRQVFEFHAEPFAERRANQDPVVQNGAI